MKYIYMIYIAHEYITEYDYNIPSTLPLMNTEAKSMPAPNIPQINNAEDL